MEEMTYVILMPVFSQVIILAATEPASTAHGDYCHNTNTKTEATPSTVADPQDFRPVSPTLQ
jgi:hypothetical protein